MLGDGQARRQVTLRRNEGFPPPPRILRFALEWQFGSGLQDDIIHALFQLLPMTSSAKRRMASTVAAVVSAATERTM